LAGGAKRKRTKKVGSGKWGGSEGKSSGRGEAITSFVRGATAKVKKGGVRLM